ncbi:MAG: alanine racemase [Rhodothermaceae bacterium]
MDEHLINSSIISEDDILRPTHLEIDLNSICHNFNEIKNLTKRKVMPILKANAYGHGLVKIAELMQELNADYLGVAVLEEALLLRKNGIKLPVLVLGGIIGNQIPLYIQNDITITASSVDKLRQIENCAIQLEKKAKVHLKIDTGMERIGIHYYSAENLITECANTSHIIIEGIFTHFADSSSSDPKYTNLQLNRFNEVLNLFEKHNLPLPEIIHSANSGAILQHPDSYFNMVRPGIILFGIYPSPEVKRSIELKPALSWKSKVVYFKVIKPDHPVGYGGTWKTDCNIRAVTAPVGYGDGYFRSMTGKAEVIINSKCYPVIGTIAMDQIVINIENDSAYNEDEIILLGRSKGAEISCEKMAKWAGTIPYEILTNINTRVPRIYL